MKSCSNHNCTRDNPQLDSEFCKKGDGLQPWCRECNRIRSRKYYAENREKHLKVVGKRRDKQKRINQEWICKYLLKHPCVDCGETDIVILEFDHLRDKKTDVSILINRYSLGAVKKEIEKCEVRCSPCHRRKTAVVQNNYRVKFLASIA